MSEVTNDDFLDLLNEQSRMVRELDARFKEAWRLIEQLEAGRA